jgi:hypothetical protein
VLVQADRTLEELLVLLSTFGGSQDDVVVLEGFGQCDFDAGASALVDVNKNVALVE